MSLYDNGGAIAIGVLLVNCRSTPAKVGTRKPSASLTAAEIRQSKRANPVLAAADDDVLVHSIMMIDRYRTEAKNTK